MWSGKMGTTRLEWQRKKIDPPDELIDAYIPRVEKPLCMGLVP